MAINQAQTEIVDLFDGNSEKVMSVMEIANAVIREEEQRANVFARIGRMVKAKKLFLVSPGQYRLFNRYTDLKHEVTVIDEAQTSLF
ncbi:MAG: hypothetical protein AAGI23_08285 [Bacteroidota bacterium]